ncbi:UNVERIFIED_ORG: PAS domain S-box-containing protein [Pseudomonas psychrophila]
MNLGGKPSGRFSGRAQDPLPEHRAAQPGKDTALHLLLDHQGRVLEVHGAQRFGVQPVSGADATRLLLDYLVPGSTQALEGTPADWLGHSLDLDFQCADGSVLHTRGWVQPHADGWLLQLLDISDLRREGLQAHNRELCMQLSLSLARQLRLCSMARLPQVTQESLQRIGEQWQVPCIALALRDEGQADWSLFSVYQAPGAAHLWEEGQSLGSALDSLSGSRHSGQAAANEQPFQFRNLLGATDGLCMPYHDQRGLCAWLLLGFSARPALMRESDWSHVCAALAGPLLERLREQQQAEHRERVQALEGLLGTGWWEWSTATEQVQLASQLAENLSAPHTLLTCKAWLALFHPADRDELSIRFDELIEHGKDLMVVARLDPPQNAGPTPWYRIQGQAVGTGSQRRIVGFMLDVSEIKRQQLQATAAHARLDNLIASSPAVIYVQRYEKGALVPAFFSASLQPLLGWTLAESQGAGLIEWIHPDDREQYFDRTRQLLRFGSARRRYRLRDSKGNYHWLLDEAKLLRDDLGLPIEAVGLWLDVTEATETTERVRRSEERYRVLVEDSPAMICRYLPDLTLTFGNQPLAAYLECTPQALPGVNLGSWLSTEQRAEFMQRIAQLTPQHPVSTAEISLQLPGHEYAWWVWSDRGVFDAQGQLLEVQAVGRDNTDVRRSQQQMTQSAKMATLGEMATGLAHEINQPLNVMRMAIANVLKRVSNGDVEHDYLQDKLTRIDAQIQRAARVVDHMRVFGRRSEVEQQAFNPAQALEGALALLCEGLRGKGIELRTECLSDALQVRGHVDQLEQVLINLLINARDALMSKRETDPDFTPWIALTAGASDSGVRVTVEDNAGGIDPRLLERIFEPFFTTKPVGLGTGLGLSVSYGIIDNMGGRLSVSNTGHGARFCVELPVVEG